MNGARIARHAFQVLVGAQAFAARQQPLPQVRHQYHAFTHDAGCVFVSLMRNRCGGDCDGQDRYKNRFVHSTLNLAKTIALVGSP
jgi:hypothetical protein